MTDFKPKKPPLAGSVRLPEQFDRLVELEAARLGIYKYEALVLAWSAYLQFGSSEGREITCPECSSILQLKSDSVNVISPTDRSSSERFGIPPSRLALIQKFIRLLEQPVDEKEKRLGDLLVASLELLP